MPVFSYLAIAKSGALEPLCAELAKFEHCRFVPADNHEVVLVVTDTPDEPAEKRLQQFLAGLGALQSLTLTFGYAEYDPS